MQPSLSASIRSRPSPEFARDVILGVVLPGRFEHLRGRASFNSRL
jgi:hypothetical protein